MFMYISNKLQTNSINKIMIQAKLIQIEYPKFVKLYSNKWTTKLKIFVIITNHLTEKGVISDKVIFDIILSKRAKHPLLGILSIK